MADRHPGSNHRGAFTRGWKDAVAALSQEREPYKDPKKDTWQAIGYRLGERHGVVDRDAMDAAWEWSVAERQQVEIVDTDGYQHSAHPTHGKRMTR